MEKPKLIVAGPGAGKTYGMVQSILEKLPDLTPSRYMAVITYTNSATENIRRRLADKINIPPNLFIGTFHSFLNRFIVIPYSSLHDTSVGKEKLFIQCEIDDLLNQYKKENGALTHQQAAYIRKSIKDSMNTRGFISFDQTVSLAKSCLENKKMLDIVSNRIRYLFIDEFQDTSSGYSPL